MPSTTATALLLLAGSAAALQTSGRGAARAGGRSGVRNHVAVSQTPATAEKAWDRDAWLQGWKTPREEIARDVGGAEWAGKLPADLVGTYYRNGHAKFEVAGTKVMHPFDADGMVTAATFMGNGTLHFRNRYVRTKGLQKEERLGKAIYSGQFGNPKPFWAGGLKLKNVANTNVIYWGGRLLALWEGGQPYKLDPLSLGTAGASNLGGVVLEAQAMTAHPRFDAANNRLVAYDYKPNPVSGTALRLFEFDDSFKLWQGRVVDKNLPGTFGLFHDFVITKNFAVFTASPQQFGGAGAAADLLLGKRAIAETLDFDATQPAKFVLIKRGAAGDEEEPLEIEVDTHFNFHFANGYESEQGLVVIDTVRADRMELGQMVPGTPVWETVDYGRDVPRSTLWRYVLDPKTGTCVSKHQVFDRYLDFPVVNKRASGLKHRYVWAATGAMADEASPPQGVIKVDTEAPENTQVWLPEPHQYCGEPCFARKQGATDASPEDEGYILTIIADGRTNESQLAVLDAANVAAGPLASVPLGVNIPHGLHGCWAEDVAPSIEELNTAQVILSMFMRKSKEWNQLDAAFSGLGISQFFGQKGMDGR